MSAFRGSFRIEYVDYALIRRLIDILADVDEFAEKFHNARRSAMHSAYRAKTRRRR